jgi:hypothetical protein
MDEAIIKRRKHRDKGILSREQITSACGSFRGRRFPALWADGRSPRSGMTIKGDFVNLTGTYHTVSDTVAGKESQNCEITSNSS